ncbi:MAG: reverse transcriptase domain-containing protein, partial [Bacteroidota bacterium]
MKAPDVAEFRKAMAKEIDAHSGYKHWKIIPKSSVPKGTRILDAVWSFRRKRRIDTQEVYRHKARLTVHGGQQQQGVNFWDTYSPVVTWPIIRLFLTMTLQNGWHSRQIDFVLAFPQADVETDIYMKVPAGYHRNDADPRHDCLKLIKNVYGIRQGPQTFNKFLQQNLEKMGFQQSKTEPCLFTRNHAAFLVYVDDGIVIAPTVEDVEHILEDLMNTGMDVEDLGSIQDYLGVRVEYLEDGKMKLAQPQLIDSILEDLHF